MLLIKYSHFLAIQIWLRFLVPETPFLLIFPMLNCIPVLIVILWLSEERIDFRFVFSDLMNGFNLYNPQARTHSEDDFREMVDQVGIYFSVFMNVLVIVES